MAGVLGERWPTGDEHTKMSEMSRVCDMLVDGVKRLGVTEVSAEHLATPAPSR